MVEEKQSSQPIKKAKTQREKTADKQEKTKRVPVVKPAKKSKEPVTQDNVAEGASASPDISVKQHVTVPDKQSGDEQSFWRQAKEFFHAYKAEISLALLVLYVITLAIATIIEILDH